MIGFDFNSRLEVTVENEANAFKRAGSPPKPGG